MNLKINKFFVYGTLRPDVKAPWSELVHNNPNFKLKYYNANLFHSKLFFHKKIGYPMAIYDPLIYDKENFTVGYILETQNIEKTLLVLDKIEEYPDLYDRFSIKCWNTDTKSEDEVYFYSLKNERLDKDQLEDLHVNDYILINK